MLGRILAANLGKQTGDHVQLYGQDFEVVGMFESFSVYENGAVFMLLDELQRQMDRPGEVTGFVVLTETRQAAATSPRIRRRDRGLDPEIAATPCAEFVGVAQQMKITRTMSWFTSMFAIVIGGVGVMNTMAMSVFERRGEIASLRAMGWRQWRVARLILERIVLPVDCRRRVGHRARDRRDVPAHALATRRRGSFRAISRCERSAKAFAVALLIAMIGAAYPACRCARLPIAETLRSS